MFTEMNSANRFEMLKIVGKFILANPKTSYTEATETLKLPELTTTQFYNVRAQLRRKGQLIDTGAAGKERSAKASGAAPAAGRNTHIEILETIDVSGFSDEIKEHYKTGILPLLRRLVPQEKGLRLVFLSDPPSLEIQRLVN